MGLFNFIRRKKPNDTPEARRALLLQYGRVNDAVILETEVNENGEEVARFVYTVHGVDFESSEILTEEQRIDRAKYAPGAEIAVRFDSRNHGNSIIV